MYKNVSIKFSFIDKYTQEIGNSLLNKFRWLHKNNTPAWSLSKITLKIFYYFEFCRSRNSKRMNGVLPKPNA